MVKAKRLGPVEVKEGEVILTESDPGKEMYIIEAGRVEIYRGTGPAEKSLRVLEAGDFFGEMSLLDDQPRAASARAVTDVKLLAIDHSTFDQMLRQYPEVAIRMLRILCERLRRPRRRPGPPRPRPGPKPSPSPPLPLRRPRPPSRGRRRLRPRPRPPPPQAASWPSPPGRRSRFLRRTRSPWGASTR